VKKINVGWIIGINMLSLKEIVKEMKIFERNKVPLEIKILGIAIIRILSCFEISGS